VSRDINGFSDPYFKLKLKSQKFTSRVMYKTLNPVYNQAGRCRLPASKPVLNAPGFSA
jgi:Ca2+-dependent lipid-binding protein